MSKLVWGLSSDKVVEFGCDRGVVYLDNAQGVPWGGLISVVETSAGADVIERYMDGRKYIVQKPKDSFTAKVDAYNYPLDLGRYFGESDYGVRHQRQLEFGLSYRTRIADAESDTTHYKIHLVYNALASPSEINYTTIGSSLDPQRFSWELTTRPLPLIDNSGVARNGSHIVVDTRYAYSWAVDALESILYGSDSNEPRLPAPAEVVEIFESASILQITDNGDGTWTATGPDYMVKMISADEFEITSPSAIFIGPDEYQVSSY